MKYKNHLIVIINDCDIDGGKYYQIYRGKLYITCAWTLSNAKEFINTYNPTTQTYCYNVLA